MTRIVICPFNLFNYTYIYVYKMLYQNWKLKDIYSIYHIYLFFLIGLIVFFKKKNVTVCNNLFTYPYIINIISDLKPKYTTPFRKLFSIFLNL